MPKGNILIVDDERSILSSLTGILKDEDYSTVAVEDGGSALDALERNPIDLVLLDVWLKEMDGVETLKRMKQMDPDLPVIMISGHGTIETAVNATKLGAYDFIEKPLSLEKVLLSVEHALEQKRLADENRSLKRKIERGYEMVGSSEELFQLKKEIATAAPTNGRVLICGENGTGKELIARAVHRQSLRKDRPFIAVNCAAIPEDLIENELFGHEKGSYTGASTSKVGDFERADGGTIFLDEIGDMSLKTQAKVLRVLEEQAFQRVGGTTLVRIDVRVIAATNKNLEEEIRKGNFREDLLYRLKVIVFRVPPLRERRSDITVLADHFLQEFSREYGKKMKRFTDRAMRVLTNYDWPGNVRELKNMIERAVIMSQGEVIDSSDIPLEAEESDQFLFRFNGDFASLREARAGFEKDYIKMVLAESDWNISRAAEKLGIGRKNLYTKMNRYNIVQP